MLFSYNWLKDYIKGKLPKPEKLAEFLTMHAFEVEEVKRTGKDWVLDIDVLPNRASDCFSHLGIAREIAAILDLRFKIEDLRLKENKELRVKDFVNVEIKNRNACQRYTARIITDVKVGPSPKWMQEKLKICGLRPINNIVDIANYVMLETGQPLHGFDLDKVSAVQNQKSKIKSQKSIIVRKAKKREKITTLDDEKYDLDEDILIIADEEGPLAIAGIKGGKKAEIDEKTKNVVLESANFNPRIIRRGSKTIDLKTDASWRFEHGIDPELTEFAVNRAVHLIQEIAGGKVCLGLADVYSQKALPKKIKLDLDYVEKLLGIKISEKEIKNILKRLGFKIIGVKPRQLWVEIPTFRLDIGIPEDLIEEIGRIYGYQKIKPVFPIASLIPPKRNLEIFWEEMVKNILKEAGFTEVYNYSFVSEEDKKIFKESNLIEVENPVSAEQKYLRPGLIPNLLKNTAFNQKFFKEIKIFELGKVFKDSKEKRVLTGVMTGETFFEAKGVVDLLLQKLGISNIWYDEYQPTRAASEEASLAPQEREENEISVWHPKKCAEIKIDHEEIGFLGEISQRILENLKINGKVVIFDIDFEKLQKLCSEEHEYQPISVYPAAVRDIAVLVPKTIRVEEVLNRIEAVGGKLIRDIDLFDIYEGEEIPEGKKNLAFHIIYQAEDRTLSSEEIDEIQNKIIKALEEEPEWEVRK